MSESTPGLGTLHLVLNRFALALVVALIPLSAWALAAIRVAPLYERLSLWVVPALYLAIASSADISVFVAKCAARRGDRSRLARKRAHTSSHRTARTSF